MYRYIHLCYVNKSEIAVFLYRKDIYGIFAFPVTDAIAPNYSSVVTNPMDFSTMMYKIENLQYPSLEAFRVIILSAFSICIQ